MNEIYEYITKLFEKEINDVAISYLKSRGISLKTILKFRMGFSSEESEQQIVKNLCDKFDTYDLVSSGLIETRDSNLKLIFINRIIMPIITNDGVASFTSRSLSDDGLKHKHMKGVIKHLYNEFLLNGNKNSPIFVTESPLDALTICQLGFDAVATFGTSNLNLYKKFENRQNIFILFDNDSDSNESNPGFAASIRFGCDIVSVGGLPFVARLPYQGSKTDVNSFFQKINDEKLAKREFLNIIDTAKPVTSFEEHHKYINKKQKEWKIKRGIKSNDLKSIPILNLLDKYGVPYIKRNGNKVMCKCPFHDDDTPSMLVNLVDNSFYCFGAGCGTHGDVITFIMEMENANYTDACKILKEEFYDAI
jgi:DNA primase